MDTSPAQDDQSREKRRYGAVATALRALMQSYPDLALEDFSYLAPCGHSDPEVWAKHTPRERMLGEHLTRLGAFDVHALRLRWPDGREELASYHEFVLRTERQPLRLLSTSWWGGAPGADSLEPAKIVEGIEIWLGSMCLDIANGFEYAGRYADEEARAQILEGAARRQAQHNAVLPAWKEARAAHPGPQIISHDEPGT